jgi:hypothetical protein
MHNRMLRSRSLFHREKAGELWSNGGTIRLENDDSRNDPPARQGARKDPPTCKPIRRADHALPTADFATGFCYQSAKIEPISAKLSRRNFVIVATQGLRFRRFVEVSRIKSNRAKLPFLN